MSFKDPSGLAPEKEKAKGNGNKTLEYTPQLDTRSPIYNTEEVWFDIPDVDGTPTMARFFARCHYMHDQQAERDRLGYFGGFSSVFSSSFGSCDIGSAGGGIDGEFGGSDICALSDQGGGKTMSNGLTFTATMSEGKKWSDLSTGQKISLISQGLSYIQVKTAQTNVEWGFTISIEGNQVIMSNFVHGSQIGVALDFDVPRSQTIVGSAHSHPYQRVTDLNAHDEGFSNLDIIALASSYIGIRNIDMNCFTAFEIKGDRIETETVINNNMLQDYVVNNQHWLYSHRQDSFDYDQSGNLKSNLEHCKAGVWYEKP